MPHPHGPTQTANLPTACGACTDISQGDAVEKLQRWLAQGALNESRTFANRIDEG